MTHRPNRFFFFTVLFITLAGFFIFTSASLGLLGRGGVSFNLIAIKQLAVLVGALIMFLAVSKMDYRFWRDYSLPLFILTLIFTALVFVPDLSFTSGGATRWVHIGPFTIQPSEFLKLGFVLYLAAYLAKAKQGVRTIRQGLLPFLMISGLVGVLLVAQPDIDMLVIMLSSGLAMYFVAGAKWSHLALLGLILGVAIATVGLFKPYIIARVQTFLHPEENVLSSSYQINQSLIAVG